MTMSTGVFILVVLVWDGPPVVGRECYSCRACIEGCRSEGKDYEYSPQCRQVKRWWVEMYDVMC